MKQIQLLGLTFLLISLIACGQTTQKNAEKDTENGWKALMKVVIQFNIQKIGI